MSGKYRTIVADPPWDYSDGFIPGYTPANGSTHEAGQPYGFLSLAEIKALPVAGFADRDSHLFLWTTNRYLPDAFGVLDSWGFTYRQTVVWHKTGRVPPFGGSVAPNHAEYLLVGACGKPAKGRGWPSNVLSIPRLDHSRKPEAFLDLIEGVSDGPYLELFARRARFGWDYWGDESLSTAQMPVTEDAA